MCSTIVSENEANLREGKLAIGTPIAKALALVDLRFVDDTRVGDRLFQFGDPHFEQPLRFAGSVVLRVLRQIALVARFGNGCRDRRTLDRPHVVEIVFEFFVTLSRQINNLLCHNKYLPFKVFQYNKKIRIPILRSEPHIACFLHKDKK